MLVILDGWFLFDCRNTIDIFFFRLNDPSPTEIYTLSLHDALPIWDIPGNTARARHSPLHCWLPAEAVRDRKSTRLNSSHQIISYAVFCLKKKERVATNLDGSLHAQIGIDRVEDVREGGASNVAILP